MTTLNRNSKVRRRWKSEMMAEQEGRCFYCRSYMKHPTFEHLTPATSGGTSARANIRLACRRCNRRAGILNLEAKLSLCAGTPRGGC